MVLAVVACCVRKRCRWCGSLQAALSAQSACPLYPSITANVIDKSLKSTAFTLRVTMSTNLIYSADFWRCDVNDVNDVNVVFVKSDRNRRVWPWLARLRTPQAPTARVLTAPCQASGALVVRARVALQLRAHWGVLIAIASRPGPTPICCSFCTSWLVPSLR